MPRKVVVLITVTVLLLALSGIILLLSTRLGGSGTGASTILATSASTSADANNPYQGILITVGFYGNDACEAGTELLTLTYDISQTCFGWTRSTGVGTIDNSATNFQCYRERVCYTQHPGNFTCTAGGPADKEFRTDACTPDTGGLWVRILSGTENCPEAPPDFACSITSR
jgi:hypothetical protein